MRALTIHQPYAYSIVAGLKHYETRTRRTSIRGRIAIHAGLKRDSFLLFRDSGITLPKSDKLAYGAVIGTVEIADCLPVEELLGKLDTLERTLGDWRPGRFAWALENPIMFPSPIPAKGKQGWWEWEERNHFRDAPKMVKTCKTCEYWEPFNGVCCNGESEYCADFTDDGCPQWTAKKTGGGG